MFNVIVNRRGKLFRNSFLKKKLHDIWEFRVLYLFMAPGILVLLIFSYAPMIGLTMVFQHYDPISGFLTSPWVGLDNFKELFMTPSFGRALRNTLFISALKLVVTFPLPIIFALCLNELRILKFKKSVQTITYLPNFISWVIVAGIWYKMLAPDDGIVNNILVSMGLVHQGIAFMGNKVWFIAVIVLSNIWKNIGFSSIFYLASIVSVDPELYESAIVDGAGRFKQVIYITLPHMKSIILLLLIFAMSGLLNADFDQLWTMQNPMVIQVADVLDTAVMRYITGGSFNNLSIGAAMGFFKAGIGLILFFVANWCAKRATGESMV